MTLQARYNPRSGWEYRFPYDNTWWGQEVTACKQVHDHGLDPAKAAQERAAARRAARPELEVKV